MRKQRIKTLAGLAKEPWKKGKRLVAPFLGFPGLSLLGISIKLAGQNSRLHFNTIKKLVETFAPDIIFPLMDLTVEANALGRHTLFPVNDYPTVPKEKFDFEEIEKLEEIDISADGRVNSYLETVKLMRRELPQEAIKGAYVTGPYTLSSQIMGAEDAAATALSSPKNLHRLCSLAARKIIEYSKELIAAGAEVICILEPSAVILGPKQFQDFSAFYVRQIVARCQNQKANTIYHVCGNSMHLIEKMVNSGANGISLDSKEAHVDLVQAAKRIP